jgi:hypothetical protein
MRLLPSLEYSNSVAGLVLQPLAGYEQVLQIVHIFLANAGIKPPRETTSSEALTVKSTAALKPVDTMKPACGGTPI